ncbi:DUF6809 family protein, partial [Zongyangia hominis]
MESILEKLFLGGICGEAEPVEDPEYKEAQRIYSKVRDKWENILPPDQREFWEKLNDAADERFYYEGKQCFLTGFRMGLRIAVESLPCRGGHILFCQEKDAKVIEGETPSRTPCAAAREPMGMGGD